jgi:hypothetical protein
MEILSGGDLGAGAGTAQNDYLARGPFGYILEISVQDSFKNLRLGPILC